MCDSLCIRTLDNTMLPRTKFKVFGCEFRWSEVSQRRKPHIAIRGGRVNGELMKEIESERGRERRVRHVMLHVHFRHGGILLQHMFVVV